MAEKPLYVDISEKILSSIEQRNFNENSSLPSERALCERYHVSRSTIRQALNHLKFNGYIYTVQGKGTFVKPIVYEQNLFKFYSFTDELRNKNINVSNVIIGHELVSINDVLASKLGRKCNEIFHKIIRLRFADSCPIMIETIYLPQNRFYHIEIGKIEKGSMASYLTKKYDLQLDRVVETFRPVLPRYWQCDLLKISSKDPCTMLERFSYENDILIQYTVSIIRGDKYIFKTDLSRNYLGNNLPL
ncbi:GntR family transcriptional regulator [Clostridium tertium]|jgi:GntR family transcriptional regulator|uniref:GntR family transcriptional regulator n=1 Tax=Clostridium tertium TaxID=1559 RepID=A0A9X4B185_9CLOT|nr:MULTISPECIES: GntR family transcriptional regulator [Clostridium]MBS5305923.1 GntR family transcriptional regulator [Clostridium sp.]MBS6500948.1 GntR family transcriptional regulator [Clostridium sp.]MBU6134154.1 GntR family transcriptional regulator [Clostridium tertium]MDB1920968.1 GntR family transcriptional regulator [Clostridium tertium]MDB1925499.1 GntR family transcriptional regulator [Clostridium tertium]